MQPKEILEAALALEPTDRVRLAQEILASLDIPVEIDPGLASEVERRAREVESGAVKAIPWSEVRARIASRQRAG